MFLFMEMIVIRTIIYASYMTEKSKLCFLYVKILEKGNKRKDKGRRFGIKLEIRLEIRSRSMPGES